MKERLDADLKEAMKAREAGRLRLSVIRMAKAAVKNAEIAAGRALDDTGVAEALARQAIAETGAAGPRETGRVMAVLMPRVKGRADGRLVSETVKRLLEGEAR